MGGIVRIGEQLFNLAHMTSMEPETESGQDVVDIHIVAGRVVRLRGDDARAARLFISTIEPLPVDQEAQDRAGDLGEAAQDRHALAFDSDPGLAAKPRS